MHQTKIVALLAAALLAGPLAHTRAHAENYEWDSMAIGGGGYVTGIVPSKSERGVIYVRTDVGGAFRWDESRQRWQALLDWVSEAETGFLGVDSLAVDPRNAANVYLLAGTSYFNNGKTAILRSTDYGKSFDVIDVSSQFKTHGNGMGRQSGEKLQVDPGDSNTLYAGTRRDGLFKSRDAGSTWQRVPGFDVSATSNDVGVSFVLLDPTSVENGAAQRLFVGVSRYDSDGPNLYFSFDGGASFEPVEGGPAEMIPQRAAMTPDGLIYITYGNGAGPNGNGSQPFNGGQIWEYDAAGGNWTNVTPDGVNSAFSGISIDPNNARRLVASTTNSWHRQHGDAFGDRIFLSLNGGRTWTNVVQRGFKLDTNGIDWIKNHAIHWAGSIEFDPFDSKSVLVTSGNGLFKNRDIDRDGTWAFHVAGLEQTVPLGAESVEGRPLVSVIGDYDGFMHTDPQVYGTIHSPQMGTTTALAVASRHGAVMARGGNALYYSTNAGASWNKSPSFHGEKDQLALSLHGSVLIKSPHLGSTHFRSTDFGATWTQVAGLRGTAGRVVADQVHEDSFYAYENGRFMVSDDGGVSFTQRSTIAANGSNLIRTVPGHFGHVWVCLNEGGLVRTVDAGRSFVKIGNVGQCGAIGFGKAAPGTSYPTAYMWGSVGGVRGMLRSTDMGATWVRINDDSHEYGGLGNGRFVVGDMNTYGMVYMSSAGRGLVYARARDDGAVRVTPVDSSAPPPTINKCEYLVLDSWQGGYVGAIRITNNRPQVINDWMVNWTYSDNSTIQGSWNAAVYGTPPAYTARPNQPWNTDIAPGASVEFGFVVNGSAIPAVTGEVCK